MRCLREALVYPQLLTRALPLVERELRHWEDVARAIPDAELRTQALASMHRKKFHCVGGAVLALYDPARLPELIRAIVAVQTISDYLDNLCDRSAVAARLSGSNAPEQTGAIYAAFLQLHESMLCAVDPRRPASDYYKDYLTEVQSSPAADGGYLDRLVDASRSTVAELPGYAAAKPLVVQLVSLYSELQAGKHLPLHVRDGVMEGWFAARYLAQPQWPGQPPAKWLGRDLHWWEFGAATGSTLAMFALICGSGDPALTQEGARSLAAQYFPAICGLHILLDYYIDQAEDVEGGDLNFVAHYPSAKAAIDALEGFVRWSMSAANGGNSRPGFHRAVVRGLLAMYLSDPKVARQGMGEQATRLLRAGGGPSAQLRSACSLLRSLLHF